MFFFCKQKTAYEMRISDWSSDVCSSDLANPAQWVVPLGRAVGRKADDFGAAGDRLEGDRAAESFHRDGDAAVGAAVAVVAHQEQMIGGDGDRPLIVGTIAGPHVERGVGGAAGLRFAPHRPVADARRVGGGPAHPSTTRQRGVAGKKSGETVEPGAW